MRSATTSESACVWLLRNNSRQKCPTSQSQVLMRLHLIASLFFYLSTEQFVFTILYMVLLLPLIVTIPAIPRSLQGLGQPVSSQASLQDGEREERT